MKLKKLLIMLLSVVMCAAMIALAGCTFIDGELSTSSGTSQEENDYEAAYAKAVSYGYDGTLEEFIETIKGEKGEQGEPGKDGQDGKDGVGIASVEINANGELIVTLTDGTVKNLGGVKGEDGKDLTACEHTYGEWTVGMEATCTSIGYQTRACSKCGDIEYNFLQATGHNLQLSEVIKPVTCTESGVKYDYCTECDTLVRTVIPALGHNYVNGVCTRCGEKDPNYTAVEATPDEYFTFTLLEDDTYEIKAKNRNNMPAEVVLPSTYNGKPVTSIGNAAFFIYSGLMSIVIPDSVTIICHQAFQGCSGLTSIVIPDSVTSIGSQAFYNCRSLTFIEIPNSVTSIGDYAFFVYSYDLKTVYYSGTEEQWNAITIGSNNECLTNATRYYYSETEPELNEDGTAYNGSYWHYDADGVTPVIWKKEN